MKLYEMEGFLRGKCLPGDLLVGESNAEYLVRKLNEAATLKAERDAQQKRADALAVERNSARRTRAGRGPGESIMSKYVKHPLLPKSNLITIRIFSHKWRYHTVRMANAREFFYCGIYPLLYDTLGLKARPSSYTLNYLINRR